MSGGEPPPQTQNNPPKKKQAEAVSHLHGAKGKERLSKRRERERSGQEACREHPTPPAHHAAAKNRHRVGHCHLYKKCSFPSSPEGWFPRPGQHHDLPSQHQDPLAGATAEPTGGTGEQPGLQKRKGKKNNNVTKPKTNKKTPKNPNYPTHPIARRRGLTAQMALAI